MLVLDAFMYVGIVVAQMVKNHLQSRRPGFDPRLGRSPGERHGNPLQCSCPENSMHRGAWQATVHGVGKSRAKLNY